MNKKITIQKLQQMKEDHIPVAWVTAYDLPFAYVAEQAGIDMILVGDSGGMVQLGYQTTNPVTMDEMISMTKSVRRGAPNTFIIGDMPQGSYEVSNEEAVRNAIRFIKEGEADVVKLEGGRRVCDRVKVIRDAGIEVMGHLGLTPQSATSFGGYRVQGKTKEGFEKLIDDVNSLQGAGVFSILLEAMPTEPAEKIAASSKIPIYGIGAGIGVNGQLVIMHDLMGFYQSFRPWFAKCYIPDVIDEFYEHIKSLKDLKREGRNNRNDGLLTLAVMALKRFIKDVKEWKFPDNDYCYPIKEEEIEEVRKAYDHNLKGLSI